MAAGGHAKPDVSDWLGSLQASWGDAYEITVRRRRLRLRRPRWCARRWATDRTVAGRSPEELLRAMSRDYVAEIAAGAHARIAAEAQAQAACVSPAMPTMFDVAPARERPYVSDGGRA